MLKIFSKLEYILITTTITTLVILAINGISKVQNIDDEDARNQTQMEYSSCYSYGKPDKTKNQQTYQLIVI